MADRIEEALKRAHPEIVDVVVHLEPAGLLRSGERLRCPPRVARSWT